MKTLIPMFGVALALAWSARAEPKKQPEKHVRWKDMPSVRSKEYRRFDKNGDGVLDEKEVQAIRDTFRLNPSDAYLQPYDRDDDKKLTDKEIAGIPKTEIDLKALEKMKAQKPAPAKKPAPQKKKK